MKKINNKIKAISIKFDMSTKLNELDGVILAGLLIKINQAHHSSGGLKKNISIMIDTKNKIQQG